MPDTRLAKARATLPEGYQFGDAKPDQAPRLTMRLVCAYDIPYEHLPSLRTFDRPDDGRRW